ncbi:transmembrane protein 145-like [Gigantopelta aegis]|uniref:transmembrane protein 145-like n=1 Tax=Gigantopelta aegis TaxID=1735272 RepID=UPI001B88928D|nr:transmembrane protein 145-like [Gigantopelta aegis]
MDSVTLMFCCFGSFSLFSHSAAKRVDGFIDTRYSANKEDWMFLTRFCFLDKGRLAYNFFYPVAHGTLRILFYSDKVWSKVYPSEKPCLDKLAVLVKEENHILTLEMGYFSGCYQVRLVRGTNQEELYWNCSGSRVFHTIRDTWWFIVASKCNPHTEKGMVLKYSLHLTNTEPHEKLYYEFSADEFNILPTDIAFCLLQLIICAVSIIFASMLKKRQLFHTTFKMFIVAAFLWLLHIILLIYAYSKYAYTGRSVRAIKAVARVTSSVSDIVFLLVVLLMGSGFSITRGRLRPYENILLLSFTFVYVFVYAMLLIWEETMFDEGLVLYIYESDAGYCLVALRIIAWVTFTYFVYYTYIAYRRKRIFYVNLFIFYTLWFYLTPVMILISNLALPLWMREKTVNGIELFIGAIGHVFFLVLTNPNVANRNFPFHVKTSQIGFLVTPPEHEQLGEIKYKVDRGPDFTALFTVSQTHTKRADKPVVVADVPPTVKQPAVLDGEQSGDSLSCENRARDNTSESHRQENEPRTPNYAAMFQVTGRSRNT